MERLDWIEGEGFEALRGQRAALVDGPVYTLLDPTEYAVAVGEGDRARLVIVHTKPESATLSIDVGENAKLSIVEMFIDEAFVECSIRQQGGSLCEVTMAELTSANVSYRIDLDGAFARSELDGLFLAADKEHCEVGVRVRHTDSHRVCQLGMQTHIPIEFPVAFDTLRCPGTIVRPVERLDGKRRTVIGPVHHIFSRIDAPLLHPEKIGMVLIVSRVNIQGAIVHHRCRIRSIASLHNRILRLQHSGKQQGQATHHTFPDTG